MQLVQFRHLFAILFIFLCSISSGQNFHIVEKKINRNLTFDSLKSSDNGCLISIFYQDDLKSDCEKSNILKNKRCKIEGFKEKLKKELNNCSFLEETTIHLYKLSKEFIYLKDEKNKKAQLNHIMAFVSNYGSEIYSAPELSTYLQKINKKSEDNFIKTIGIYRTKSIFEFSSEIYKKGNSTIDCPNGIHILNRKKDDLLSGRSCPALDIPFEDIFIKHLTLLFKPNYVFNQHLSNNKKRISELERKNDSLNNLLESKITKLRSLFREGSVELNGQLGLVNGNSIKGDLESLQSSVSHFNSIELSFNKQINQKINLHASIGVFNSKGNFTMNNAKDTWNDDIGAEYPLERTIQINNFEESWQINNGITAKLGLSHILKLINDKLLISAGGDIGIIFPFLMTTKLEKGSFNYRGKIKNIEGELTNINSLGLYENVTYSSTLSQKSQFSGYTLDLNTSATYSFTKKMYSKIFFQYSLYQLNNKDYNLNSNISRRYGEFSSSVFQTRSLNLSIFSAGIGVGIKF